MKLLTVFPLLLLLAACGPESSPEGRMRIKLDGIKKDIQNIGKVQTELDSLKKQNTMLFDSIRKINMEIRELKQKK